MPGLTYPPFPEGLPTHPLLVIDYQLIKQGDKQEIDRLWEAATKLGFWYLKNHGVVEEIDAMFDMGAETLKLPLEEKMKFEQGDSGNSFGYKVVGGNAVDESGALDTIELINVSRNDALAWPGKVHRDYPSTVNERMESVIKPFVQKSMEINFTCISTFDEKLGLPKGTLLSKHAVEAPSCCEARCIKKAPGVADDKQAIGSHTDFGSLSFLHNRNGGLQVLPPGSDEWQYIKPIPGHAVCNIGDALSIFSGGILRSNLHRVVTPPKEQAAYERWSLVFFTRPADDTELRAFTELSPMIADAVANNPNPGKFSTGQTSRSWYYRRMAGQRINNRKGPETWRGSRGTEHKPYVY
ncbi:Clavaminate synthase-like protein [Trametopsis cervina]|nr:Clavaminate synthase-like protein [Trametopsis cervina]